MPICKMSDKDSVPAKVSSNSDHVYAVPTEITKSDPVPTKNPCYGVVGSKHRTTRLQEQLSRAFRNQASKKRTKRKSVCFGTAVGVILALSVCICLALGLWSALEIRRLRNSSAKPSDNQLELLHENISALFSSYQVQIIQEIDSLQNQIANAAEAVDSLRSHFMTGHLFSIPASSCWQISSVNSSSPSGYYWVRAFNGSAVRVYCDMTRSCGGVTGGWMRVAYLQFENGSDPCPDGFRERRDSGIRTCGIDSAIAACPSVLFDSHNINYRRVCGKVLAYQDNSTDAFAIFGLRTELSPLTIDSNYVDGVSLTHGRRPRKHIWTFAAAQDEGNNRGMSLCPCSYPGISTQLVSTFVGQHYFCDSGVQGRFSAGNFGFLGNNPLWDGAGCGLNSTCCSFNNPPWFYRELPQPTTDDIEMRVCRDQPEGDEDIPLANVEIYVD